LNSKMSTCFLINAGLNKFPFWHTFYLCTTSIPEAR
jgi:hypothetical protein